MPTTTTIDLVAENVKLRALLRELFHPDPHLAPGERQALDADVAAILKEN